MIVQAFIIAYEAVVQEAKNYYSFLIIIIFINISIKYHHWDSLNYHKALTLINSIFIISIKILHIT